MSAIRRLTPSRPATGGPGLAPTWTSSAKDMVGCPLGPSRIWFTLGYGILNEVYYPRVDQPQIRDLGFIVADGSGFWVEVKRLRNYDLRLIESETPAVEVLHRHERFTLRLRVTPDPGRDVLAVEVTLEGDAALRPYVLIAPRLGASGYDNTARIQDLGGRRVLTAEGGRVALALAAVGFDQSDAIGPASAGFVGVNDGWQDFDRHGEMRWHHTEAGPGNVAMMAALPRRAVIGLGFGNSAQAAATLAVSSLMCPFDTHLDHHLADWRRWREALDDSCFSLGNAPAHHDHLVTYSAMVLRSQRDQTYPGTMVASLSIPWGNTHDDRAGYHLVWPRDLVACAGALLAVGAAHEARDTLRYLLATQSGNGHWVQNQWLGGTPHWTGVQLDQVAAPVLLAVALEEQGALDGIKVADMVRRALAFIIRTGPSSEQDRWEENRGINLYTLANCIAALVAGAKFLTSDEASFALAIADFWNASIEDWAAVHDTEMARRLGLDGYYVRIAPPEVVSDIRSLHDLLQLKNQEPNTGAVPYDAEISTDFLQLVRFGLRAPDDRLVRDTLKVVDELLKVETPNGPAWRRYNGDGYGEHDDGTPYDGHGRGRAWPLLTGERGHYELAAGGDPLCYIDAMAAMAGPAGLIPEQVWDSAPIASRGLFPGKPSGSAMPLAWAHAELVKLIVSRALGHVFDCPKAVTARYAGRVPECSRCFWFENAPIAAMPRDSSLSIVLDAPAIVHWGLDDWRSVKETETRPTGFGLHEARLEKAFPDDATRIVFTWRSADCGWKGRDFSILRQTR